MTRKQRLPRGFFLEYEEGVLILTSEDDPELRVAWYPDVADAVVEYITDWKAAGLP